MGIQEHGPDPSLACLDTARGQATANGNAKFSCTDIKGSRCAKQPPPSPSVVKGEAARADITASLSGLEDKTGCGVSSSSLCAVSLGYLLSAPPVSDHMLHHPGPLRFPAAPGWSLLVRCLTKPSQRHGLLALNS